jgi:DNA repair exonuclease SbcCD ATPase subunit
MHETTWAAVAFVAVSALITGVKLLWNYIQSSHARELETKDERIQQLQEDNARLEAEKAAAESRADTYKRELDGCQQSRDTLGLTASRVEELHKLTILQGEKIASLENRVEQLSLLTEDLKGKLTQTSQVNRELEEIVRSQEDIIRAYEKAFSFFGQTLQQFNGGNRELAQPVVE